MPRTLPKRIFALLDRSLVSGLEHAAILIIGALVNAVIVGRIVALQIACKEQGESKAEQSIASYDHNVVDRMTQRAYSLNG